MGKGDTRRPRQISRHEEDLRWALALGKISFKTFEERYKALHREGLIHRSGEVVRG
jgi:hypothetical protein